MGDVFPGAVDGILLFYKKFMLFPVVYTNPKSTPPLPPVEFIVTVPVPPDGDIVTLVPATIRVTPVFVIVMFG